MHINQNLDSTSSNTLSRGPVDARLTFPWLSVYASYLSDPFYTCQISPYGLTTKLSGSVRTILLIVANYNSLHIRLAWSLVPTTPLRPLPGFRGIKQSVQSICTATTPLGIYIPRRKEVLWEQCCYKEYSTRKLIRNENINLEPSPGQTR